MAQHKIVQLQAKFLNDVIAKLDIFKTARFDKNNAQFEDAVLLKKFQTFLSAS